MSDLLGALKPTPSGWSSATAYCTWSGVSCSSSGDVTSITLSSKSLSGTLPSSLSNLGSLATLSLQGNQLSGPIPAFPPSVQALYLDSNNFTSVSSLAGLTNLQTLSVTQNINLAPWSLPSSLSASASLAMIYAGSSNLVGTIPDFLGSLQSLTELRLSYNNLTGAIPGSFSGSSIQFLWLNNQVGTGLSGGISVLSSMTQLSQVWLQKNGFSGEIPDLSNCGNLFDLQLRDNSFTGLVPTSLLSMKNLLNVTLDNNKLQGPVPSSSGSMKLTYDGNNFCRSSPGPCDLQVMIMLQVAGGFGYPLILADSWTGNDACGGWSFVGCQGTNVTSITLSKQGLNGTISPAFANLTSLRTLLLNDNNLSGPIPQGLTSLPNLQAFDVSNNNLSGTVPVFPASVKFFSSGNPFLGKDIAGGSGSGSRGNSSSPPGSSGGSKVSAGVIVGVVVGVLIVVLIMLFVSYKLWYLKRKHAKFSIVRNPDHGLPATKTGAGTVNGLNNGYAGVLSELQSQSSGDHSEFPVFDGGNVSIPIEVLRQVTNNFSDDNILGRGGFGIVYKGELHDGTKIAVKRMVSVATGTKGMNEFQAEIRVLTKVRHRHLVALLGFCINGDERLLVYEYMPQGTLTQHLFEWQEKRYLPLTWKQRVTIALDVARGVEYLHSLAQQSFIHRDLKPSNILLGDDMRAKVADFGLVKHAQDGKYSVETRLAGTFGYLAPEYAATGRVTTKVDVFAFGVVLMELITGRKALDDAFPEENAHLVTWFRRVLINKENIPKAIDQTLNPDEETLESIIKVSELAGHCTAREPFQRPDMGHAVNMLAPLVEQWKPLRQEEDENEGIDLHMSLPQMVQGWHASEGTSSTFDNMSFSYTQVSIPPKASGFPDSFSSSDCR
ncbi:hypothetical protein MLD38_010982 [Melastoma candidum]|uniref:Uncharacterized protein n=1 Tax=Melastoma candidum TaxID=119954 RepID=A0ACB9R1M2_9MYRT|nr:hypothetical protein MLD38_010982 [Melastoma candidum]